METIQLNNTESKNLFSCILGLNGIESKVLSYLLNHRNVSTKDLKLTFNKDRSSIQRALTKLFDAELIDRTSISIKEFNEQKGVIKKDTSKDRGYLYVYGAKDLEEVKLHLHRLLDDWYAQKKKQIDDLDDVLDCFKEEC